MHEAGAWEKMLIDNPGHSQWYIDRFRGMAERGDDIVGEGRLVDAVAPRGALVLDAGCGPGRVGGYLHRCGHRVVGVDIDPTLIAAAKADHPGPTWIAGNLADLDLSAAGIDDPVDVVVCAGNVMTFVAPSTRRPILERFARHLAPEGRALIGFGAERGYAFDAFLDDAAQSGLAVDLLLSTWDLRPYVAGESEFVVASLRVR